MTTVLYAQPYDIDATGFAFESAEEYRVKAGSLVNRFGQKVEEFEIQFIDGKPIDAVLAKAIGLHQGDLVAFFGVVERWDEHQKQAAIISAGECGYRIGWDSDPDDLDLDIYEMESLRELAEHFVEDGLFGDIPERLVPYLDLDAIARDLGCDYAETEIAGTRLVYRCG